MYRYLLPIKAGYVHFYIILKIWHDSLLLTPFHLSDFGYTMFFLFLSVAYTNKSEGSLTGEETIYICYIVYTIVYSCSCEIYICMN